jgi:hypothetical protein
MQRQDLNEAHDRTGDELDKADFTDIYHRPDPRAYYQHLGALDYEVPHHGQRVFNQLLRAVHIPEPTVVDLCCSYGVNAALLKHNLALDDLYGRYRSPDLAYLSPDELAEADRSFYTSHRRRDAPTVIGVDVAVPAVRYALKAGLLDAGTSEDLEHAALSSTLADFVADADLITVTGGIGYITERTFERLLACSSTEQPPWVAALCLRTVPYGPIAETLAEHGLVTELLPDRTFRQRRFADSDERAYALQTLSEQGIDPEGKESEGAYHANVYLSRPAGDVAELPVHEALRGI